MGTIIVSYSVNASMEISAVVMYKGALAYYIVDKGSGQLYKAHLTRYGGAPINEPPSHLQFIEEGRHCFGNTNNQELMDELCYTVKQQIGGNIPPQQQNPPKRS
ncbi:hypothetical protein SY85_10810 [Flavisolibacter tropicus]|uniref:Uncharacterized protein n=2 Tax=Flavisolibacter tropicus TaxID=1492898 RepID=A0A172TV50_9BACT|nr:hypothetical protein SY85_10810 [Flavisolibacter tropicus]